MDNIKHIAKGGAFDIAEAIRALAAALLEIAERLPVEEDKTALDAPRTAETAATATKKK